MALGQREGVPDERPSTEVQGHFLEAVAYSWDFNFFSPVGALEPGSPTPNGGQ